MGSQKSNSLDRVTMYIIKILRKYFINTWVFRLPVTPWIYKRVFYLGRKQAPQEIVFRGKKLLVHTKDITIVPSLINQTFEEYELELFEKLLQPGMTVLDIGANIGVYSIAASDVVGDSGAIYAFEPVPENLEMFTRNLAINDVTNVHPINTAVGDRHGSVEISIVKDSLATHYIGAESKDSISVDVVTIDSFVKTNRLAVDVIKMDIEGYEGYAIDGAEETLGANDLTLLTEFSEEFIVRSGKDPSIVAEKLLSIFQYCYVIDERNHRLIPVTKVSEFLGRANNFILTKRPLGAALFGVS